MSRPTSAGCAAVIVLSHQPRRLPCPLSLPHTHDPRGRMFCVPRAITDARSRSSRRPQGGADCRTGTGRRPALHTDRSLRTLPMCSSNWSGRGEPQTGVLLARADGVQQRSHVGPSSAPGSRTRSSVGRPTRADGLRARDSSAIARAGVLIDRRCMAERSFGAEPSASRHSSSHDPVESRARPMTTGGRRCPAL